MLASTIPDLKTLALSYANSHNYFSWSTVILKCVWFQIQEPGEPSPVLCLCILQVYIGCKMLLQGKRWNPQACKMDKYSQLARGTSFVSDCCIQEDLTTCAFKGNSSRWLWSVSSFWHKQVLAVISLTETTSWPRFRCKGYLCANVACITKVIGCF